MRLRKAYRIEEGSGTVQTYGEVVGVGALGGGGGGAASERRWGVGAAVGVGDAGSSFGGRSGAVPSASIISTLREERDDGLELELKLDRLFEGLRAVDPVTDAEDVDAVPATTPLAAAEADAQTFVRILGRLQSPLKPRALVLLLAPLSPMLLLLLLPARIPLDDPGAAKAENGGGGGRLASELGASWMTEGKCGFGGRPTLSSTVRLRRQDGTKP